MNFLHAHDFFLDNLDLHANMFAHVYFTFRPPSMNQCLTPFLILRWMLWPHPAPKLPTFWSFVRCSPPLLDTPYDPCMPADLFLHFPHVRNEPVLVCWMHSALCPWIYTHMHPEHAHACTWCRQHFKPLNGRIHQSCSVSIRTGYPNGACHTRPHDSAGMLTKDSISAKKACTNKSRRSQAQAQACIPWRFTLLYIPVVTSSVWCAQPSPYRSLEMNQKFSLLCMIYAFCYMGMHLEHGSTYAATSKMKGTASSALLNCL